MDGNGIRFCARRNREIVFQLLLVAIVNQIDAGIKFTDTDFGKRGHARVPLRGVVAGEVIDLAGQFDVAADLRQRAGAGELHPHGCHCAGGFAKHDLGFSWRNQKLAIMSVRDELLRVDGLAAGFKEKGQVGWHDRGLGRRG